MVVVVVVVVAPLVEKPKPPKFPVPNDSKMFKVAFVDSLSNA